MAKAARTPPQRTKRHPNSSNPRVRGTPGAAFRVKLPGLQNLFAAPDDLPEELSEVLARGGSMRIERIVSLGHVTPDGQWYDQDEHEWVAVLSGQARLGFDTGDSVELGAGDTLLIAAHQRHRVEWTTPHTHTVWLAVFFAADA